MIWCSLHPKFTACIPLKHIATGLFKHQKDFPETLQGSIDLSSTPLSLFNLLPSFFYLKWLFSSSTFSVLSVEMAISASESDWHISGIGLTWTAGWQIKADHWFNGHRPVASGTLDFFWWACASEAVTNWPGEYLSARDFNRQASSTLCYFYYNIYYL